MIVKVLDMKCDYLETAIAYLLLMYNSFMQKCNIIFWNINSINSWILYYENDTMKRQIYFITFIINCFSKSFIFTFMNQKKQHIYTKHVGDTAVQCNKIP